MKKYLCHAAGLAVILCSSTVFSATQANEGSGSCPQQVVYNKGSENATISVSGHAIKLIETGTFNGKKLKTGKSYNFSGVSINKGQLICNYGQSILILNPVFFQLSPSSSSSSLSFAPGTGQWSTTFFAQHYCPGNASQNCQFTVK